LKFFVLIGLLFYVGINVFQFNFTLFLKDIYHGTPVLIGSILTFVGICEIITRAILLPWLLKLFSDKNIGTAGLIIVGIGLGLILTSIYVNSAVVISLAVIAIISGEGLFDPIYNGILSKSVEENEQRKLQGLNQSLQSANNVLVPLGVAAIYFYSPTILYATVMFIAFGAAVMFTNYNSSNQQRK